MKTCLLAYEFLESLLAVESMKCAQARVFSFWIINEWNGWTAMWRPSKCHGKKPNYAELWSSVKRWRVIQRWCTEKLHYVYPLWQHNDNQQFIHYAITSFPNAICGMSALITIYLVLHDMGLLPRQLKMKFCFKLLLLFSFWIKLSQKDNEKWL